MNEGQESYADLLRTARERAGLTQSEAVRALNRAGIEISDRSYTGYENEEYEPRGKKKRRILDMMRRLARRGDGGPALVDVSGQASVRGDEGLPDSAFLVFRNGVGEVMGYLRMRIEPVFTDRLEANASSILAQAKVTGEGEMNPAG